MQTFGVLQEIMKYHRNTYGLVMGGAHRETEAKKLQNGKIHFSHLLVVNPCLFLDMNELMSGCREMCDDILTSEKSWFCL